MGIPDQVDDQGNDLKGIIPKSVRHIFGYIDGDDKGGKKFLVRCSYLEIYNENIIDLLSKVVGNDKGKKSNANMQQK